MEINQNTLEDIADLIGMSIKFIRKGKTVDAHECLERALNLLPGIPGR